VPLGYHSPNAYNGGDEKKPGLAYREQQVAAAEGERAQYASEAESPITGNVSTRRALDVAKRALKRQQQYAAGQYPSGQ
jgi:hypothetical protein